MKRIFILFAAIAMMCGINAVAADQNKQQVRVYGVAFYNLENLFDTINANGSYDLEFSPHGSRQWNSHKYWSKIKNMAYAISRLTTPTTPKGPAIIGVSEIENKSVLDDLVRDPQIRSGCRWCTMTRPTAVAWMWVCFTTPGSSALNP